MNDQTEKVQQHNLHPPVIILDITAYQ